MVTKQRITTGIATYMKQYIIPGTTDVWSKRIMGGLADLIAMKPDTVDRLVSNFPLLEMLEEEEGKYDLELIEKILKKNINEYGNISLDILGGTYIFTVQDIDNMINCIGR